MPCEEHLGISVTLYLNCLFIAYTGMRRMTTDRIYDGGYIRLKYHCVTIAYSVQYSNMLYSFVA